MSETKFLEMETLIEETKPFIKKLDNILKKKDLQKKKLRKKIVEVLKNKHIVTVNGKNSPLLQGGLEIDKITLTSTSKKALLNFVKFFKLAGVSLSLISLPTKIKRICLLKSPHVYKKAKEHFELRTFRMSLLMNRKYSIYEIKPIISYKPSMVQLKYIFSSTKK